LALEDGRVFNGRAAGAITRRGGEVVFNTSLTGYQEVFTDPSYAGQIVCLTYPHIGNVGANLDDEEAGKPYIESLIVREFSQIASNWRSTETAHLYLNRHKIPVIWDIDTRALTALIRDKGMPNGVIAHEPSGRFDLDKLRAEAKAWPGLLGLDLVPEVTAGQSYSWEETRWLWGRGYGRQEEPQLNVVAVDYGLKRNILRCLASSGCKVTVVPATTTAAEILERQPDGVFLSNGPGDPAATGVYAVPQIERLVASGVPIFGICLGHQMLGLAIGAKTRKMHQGHHGANHPVKDYTTGKVEITAMNHGFTIDRATLPERAEETHVSLFDNSNCGLRLRDRPVFSVQYHPEASPGPEDSHYLFVRFANLMRGRKGLPQLPERPRGAGQ